MINFSLFFLGLRRSELAWLAGGRERARRAGVSRDEDGDGLGAL